MRSLLLVTLCGCGRVAFDSVDAIADPDGDPDRDGVLNATDNCPQLSNADQHDEDHDMIGDTCDPCPHSAVSTSDTDGDRVGDICDPAPGTPGNTIAAFVTFDGTSAPSGWTPTAGAWTFSGDVGSIALVTDSVALLTTPTLTGDMVVSIRFTVDAVNGPGGAIQTRNVSIIDNYDPVSDSGLWFGFAVDVSVGPASDISILQITNSVSTTEYATFPVDQMIHIAKPYVLTYRRTGAHRVMTLIGEEGTFDLAADLPDTGGSFGIRARGTTVRFDYLIAIQ